MEAVVVLFVVRVFGQVMVVWSVFRSTSLLVDYWFGWGLRRSNGGKRHCDKAIGKAPLKCLFKLLLFGLLRISSTALPLYE